MKVLLATDGSHSSEVALQALIAMARPQETEVRIVHVIEIWPVHIHTPEWDRERSDARRSMWARGEEIVIHAARVLEKAGFHVTTAVREGDPRTGLIDAASDWHADLIMVGSHGRTGLDRLLMGSVSEAVAHHAPCSVQIVRSAKS
jgi:nucleotide-binding universal stress UspA family protein